MIRRYSRVWLAVAPRVLVLLMLATLLLPGPAARAAAPAPTGPQAATSNLIKDGGFESSVLDSPWSAFMHDAVDPTRTTPLCNTVLCAGGNLARSGNGWALFGGDVGPVQSAITQTVMILPGFTRLRFWLSLPSSSGVTTDTLKVLVDGQPIWQTDAMTTTYALTYTLVTVNLDPAKANGQSHIIAFNSTTNSPDTGIPTTFVVDDVSLDTAYHIYLPLVEK